MPDLVSRLILESEVGDAEKKIADVRQEQARLVGEIAKSRDITGEATDETKKLLKELKESKDTESELVKAIERTNDAYGRRGELLEEQRKFTRDLQDDELFGLTRNRQRALRANEQFDRTSNDVSLAGDLESNARTIGGAFGAFGATGAERAISQIAEIPAVIEALPRLKEAFVGMPAAIGQAVTALGPAGLAFAAVGIAATALFTALNNAEQEIIEANKRQRDSFADLTREIVSGSLTTDEVNSRLADLNREREAEQRLLEAQEAEYQAYIETTGALAKGVQFISAVEEERVAAIDETKKRIEALNESEEGLTAARESSGVAANDAAEAEKRLADERRAALLNDAQLAGQLEDLRLRSQDFTAEQIQTELEGIERRRAAIQAELGVLTESGDTSDQVQQQIQKLNTELDALGQKSGILNSVTPAAEKEAELSKAREETTATTDANTEASKRATQAEQNRNKAIQDAERALEKQRQAQQQYAETVSRAKTNFQNAIQDIQTDFRDNVIDNQEDTRRGLADITRDYDREEQQAAREQNRTLAQLRKDAQKEESDSVRNRDFAALARAREDAKDARDDAVQTFVDEGQERKIEAEYQRQDIVTEAQRTTRDLRTETLRQQRDANIALQREVASAKQKLSFEQQAYAQSLQLTQQFGKSLVGTFQSIFSQIGGINGRGSQSSSTSTDQRLLDLTSAPRFGAN